jgi:hypothetical protein
MGSAASSIKKTEGEQEVGFEDAVTLSFPKPDLIDQKEKLIIEDQGGDEGREPQLGRADEYVENDEGNDNKDKISSRPETGDSNEGIDNEYDHGIDLNYNDTVQNTLSESKKDKKSKSKARKLHRKLQSKAQMLAQENYDLRMKMYLSEPKYPDHLFEVSYVSIPKYYLYIC